MSREPLPAKTPAPSEAGAARERVEFLETRLSSLSESRETIREISKSTHMLGRMDANGVVTEISRNVGRMLGVSQGEATGPNGSLGRRLDGLALQLRRGDLKPYEVKVEHADGTPRWLEISARPMPGESEGADPSYMVVLQDITRRRIAEDDLRKSEAKFSIAFHSAPFIMLISKLSDGVVLEANENFYRATGLTEKPEAILDRTHYSPWPSDEERDRVVERLRSEGSLREYEVNTTNQAGERLVSLLSAETVEIDGELCAIWQARNVTEQREAQEELVRHQQHLEELVEERTRDLEASRDRLSRAERLASIGTFATGIAHEINNPLAGILAAAEFALATPGDPDAARRALESIVDAAVRGGRIVDSVLTFARDESAEKQPADVNAIVQNAGMLLRSVAARRDALLSIELAEAVRRVEANATELQRVIINLVQNALEAGSSRVVLSTGDGDAGVEIRIEDDGPGLDEETHEHLFDPFYTTRSNGTGLGLSIVYGIVTDHGGTIELANGERGGARAVVTLPATSC